MAKKAYVWDGTAWQEITSDSSIPGATTSNTGIVQLVDSVSSTSTANAAVPNSVKTAYDQAVTATTNAATAQSTANSKAAVATTAPADVAGTAAVGTGTTSARADHVHVGVPVTRTLTGTAPITVGGVSGTGQALSADLTVAATAATVSAAGVVQLTNSAQSTSATTAATPNAVLQSIKNVEVSMYNSTTIVGNYPSYLVTSTSTSPSGNVIFTRHIPQRNMTVSNISFISGTVVSSGLTLARFGIYTRSGTTFTLVARTASDTTIYNTASTRYTRALSTTGGYPATYDFVAGNEYFVATIQVGTTPGANLFTTGGLQATINAFGAMNYSLASQTDLPTTGTGTASTARNYSEVS